LLGPLPPAQGNLKYVVVAVEYFSKWIEAKPLATITSATVHKFFWQNIVCRFRVPKAITVDNGTQFDAEAFKEFCEQIGTKICFASVRHAESNGLVERANGIIMTGIMKLTLIPPKYKAKREKSMRYRRNRRRRSSKDVPKGMQNLQRKVSADTPKNKR
jgi:transposase InsO family protein